MNAARLTMRILGLGALAAVGFFGATLARALWLDAPTTAAPPAALTFDSSADLTAGPAHAAVTVRIFGDYECPACRALERNLGDTLLSLARNGGIRLVYIHRPLAGRQDAGAAAALVACEPDPDLRWRLHAQLYAADHSATAAPDVAFADRVRGLLAADSPRAACATSDSMASRTAHAIAVARAAGFHEVPTVVVNDRHVRFRSHQALLRRIHEAIADAGGQSAPTP